MSGVRIEFGKAIPQIVEDALGGEDTLLYAAMTWHRLYSPFVPMRQGWLDDMAEYGYEGDHGTITHVSPYAHRQYHGEGFNFSKERHPLASAHWDDAAIAAGKGEDLAHDVEAYIKRK